MSLHDLIVQKPIITESLLERVLKPFARLVEGDREVVILQEADKLLNKHKVLLYLAGIRAWDFLESIEKVTYVSNTQIQKALKIEGNTLRPILKSFRDSEMVDFNEDGHAINYKGAIEIENIDIGEPTHKHFELIDKQFFVDNAKTNETRRINDAHEFNNDIANNNKTSASLKFRELKNVRDDNISKNLRVRNDTIFSTLQAVEVEKYLEILRNVKNVEKYLIALHLAETHQSINGLTASEINLLLTEPPFKLSRMFTTNISRDLGNNFKKKAWVYPVEDRGKGGIVYRMTGKGRERLAELGI